MAELSKEQKTKLIGGLKRHYKVEVVYGKGGFFVRGKGHVSIPKARKITGIKGEKRRGKLVTGGYGDYAWMRKIAGRV